VTAGPYPEYDIPEASLEQVRGTIIDQHPAGELRWSRPPRLA
jgi:hypothetical protein